MKVEGLGFLKTVKARIDNSDVKAPNYARYVANATFNYHMIKSKIKSGTSYKVNGVEMPLEECHRYVMAYDKSYKAMDPLYQDIFAKIVFYRNIDKLNGVYTKSTFYRYRRLVFKEFILNLIENYD